MCEFPFISTCLRLGLHSGIGTGTRVSLNDVQEQPLGTAFRNDQLEYGMVGLDISVLDDVRYGIVGCKIEYMAEVRLSNLGQWDAVEGGPSLEGPVPVLEENCSRAPLSAPQYMKKFKVGSEGFGEGIQMLDKQPLVEERALDCMYSSNLREKYAYAQTDVWPAASEQKMGEPEEAPADSDLDQAIDRLIYEPLQNDSLNRAKLDQCRNHPNFQKRLLKSFHKSPFKLSTSGSSTQLLRLAYAGRPHLNWVAFRTLSYESIAATLESKELRNAQALSLCVDDLADSPDVLFNVLSYPNTPRILCLLQSPTRANNDASAHLFAQLCASPSASSILQTKKLVLTCSYSAPYRRGSGSRTRETLG